mmetsp:Transcript_40305/g.56030  ORF Transcript_40305/g.56030 Transcript_40305/m.56030 type:complete len:686 (+) Transcript_40305:68-2125(+)
MKSELVFVVGLFFFVGMSISSPFRPPAIPLVAIDPYISIWSTYDHLYDGWPTHWSGSIVGMDAMIRVNGTSYCLMGGDNICQKNAQQNSVTVDPTQTIYTFFADDVFVVMKFTTPSILDDKTVLQFNDPVTFLTFQVGSISGTKSSVQIYFDTSAEIAVDDITTSVDWNRPYDPSGKNDIMRIGATLQQPLSNNQDRISWGFWHVSIQSNPATSTSMTSDTNARTAFVNGQPLPPDDTSGPRPCNDEWPVLALTYDFGQVGKEEKEMHFSVGYDDTESIKYFSDPFKAAWTTRFPTFPHLLDDYEERYYTLMADCYDFDTKLKEKLDLVGGEEYSRLGSLVYRQVTASTKLVWNDRISAFWLFVKEISSDGDVSTVDVLYPASPFFLFLSPESLKLQLFPLLEYSNNQTAQYGLDVPYNLAWSPHHLGVWPVCDIRPEDQEQMPMEETGNMFIMMASVAQHQSCDVSFLEDYWPLLAIWGDYLNSSLPDPQDQLCTDDFEGPSPQNVNLAAKGIVGLAAYSYLLNCSGDHQNATRYYESAVNFVPFWLTNADDGDHYRLQYNLSGTWSVKYNLLFDLLIGTNLFPSSVYEEEITYYLGDQLNQYGMPLDDRATFGKADWNMWAAAMSPEKDQFLEILSTIYDYANSTTSRVPLTDWYDTISGDRQGFQARPVMGGVFAAMLRDWA